MAHLFWLPPIVRWAMARASARTGIDLRASAIGGSLLSGRVELTGVTACRAASDTSTFELRAERVIIDLDLWRLLRDARAFDEVELQGVRGEFARAGPPPRSERRPFSVAQLRIADAALTVIDRTAPDGGGPMRLTVERWETRPLASDSMLRDLLFRTNAAGALDGSPFTAESRPDLRGGVSRWQAARLPARLLGAQFGPPLDWFDAGEMDVTLQDQWTREPATTMQSDVTITFRKVTAILPGGIGRLATAAATRITTFINKQPGEWTLKFGFAADEKQVSGYYNGEASTLGEAAADAMTNELARLAGVDPERLRDLGRRATERLRERFRRVE